MISFSQFKQIAATINEAKEMLDISIPHFDKLKPDQQQALLDQPVTVTEKFDGTKISLIRNSNKFNPKDFSDNWIVAYKSNIINPEDVAYADSDEVKTHSNGISQYKLVFEALAANHKNTKSIPPNTEIFAEFIQRKPTLSREYQVYHGVIILASSPTTYTTKIGKVFSKSSGFDTSKRDEYARLLGFTVPNVVFRGKLREIGSVDKIKEKFLNMKSIFGGKPEGVVMEFANGQIFKIVQPDQYDKQVRAAIKAKSAPMDETAYWKKIREIAFKIVSKIDIKQPLKTIMSDVSREVYSMDLSDIDGNKKPINIKDDLLLTCKTLIQRQIHKGALFIGRMSPLSIMHHSIISDALRTYDSVTVCLVKAKIDDKNPFPVELQQEMLDRCFGDKIEVIVTATGNLSTVLQKSKNLISYILAGTDRVEGYKSQMAHSPDIKVVEIPRVNEVSGTLVRNAIAAGDEATFRKYTPPCIHDLYKELKGHIDKF